MFQSHRVLGILLELFQRDPVGAKREYHSALSLNPDYANVRFILLFLCSNVNIFQAHFCLANLLFDQGEIDDAQHEFTETLSIDPNFSAVSI